MNANKRGFLLTDVPGFRGCLPVAIVSAILCTTALGQWSNSMSNRFGGLSSRFGGGSSQSSGLGGFSGMGSGMSDFGGMSGFGTAGSQSSSLYRSSNFVGGDTRRLRDSSGQSGTGGSSGRSNDYGGSGLNSSNYGSFDRENRSNNRDGEYGTAGRGFSTNEIPSRLRLGTELSSPVSSPVEATLTDRLARTFVDRASVPLAASVENETVVLRGEVATEHDRLLAQRLARLEPGVRQVRNEIVVVGKTAAPGSPKASAPAPLPLPPAPPDLPPPSDAKPARGE